MALAQVLRPLSERFPAELYPELLVGLGGTDDAAVMQLRDDEAMIATVDFFPPVVDDPYSFGAIAAANAMSDVFAMGGQVLLALNLLGWPEDADLECAATVLRGGAEKVREAGAVVAGGHTIIDREPKYGMAVLGRVHPSRVLRLSGARPGDALVLTKPLGTGLITTALKQGAVEEADLAAAVESMASLNQAAAGAATRVGAHAATDVTGFSLVGHGLELADASGVGLRIEVDALPLLPNVLNYARTGFAPGGTCRNREAYSHRVSGLARLGEGWSDVLFDAQTSGGLLLALDAGIVADFAALASQSGAASHVVGGIVSGQGIELV